MAETNNSILGLDVGDRRVGVAVAGLEARLPRPLTTLINDDSVWGELKKLIATEQAAALVVGLPRGQGGQLTDQTAASQRFAEEAGRRLGLPVHLQDESVTTKKAEAELAARGRTYTREDVDALAAVYILEDWLSENAVK